jgi:hypothetical protein
MFRTLIILLIFLLSSCQGNIGNKSTIRLYKQSLDKGESLDKIIKIYGNYSDKWQGENGNNIYQYSYSKNSYDLISHLPIINHFGWIKSENYEVLLSFDEKELLIEERKFFNRAKSRNSLICNPLVYSCVRKIY